MGYTYVDFRIVKFPLGIYSSRVAFIQATTTEALVSPSGGLRVAVFVCAQGNNQMKVIGVAGSDPIPHSELNISVC